MPFAMSLLVGVNVFVFRRVHKIKLGLVAKTFLNML